MKLVVLGDAHLRDQTWTGVRLYGDSIHAAREVVEAANQMDAILVQSGDLFDSGLNVETPRVLREAAEMFLNTADIVHTVGNHDRPKSAAGRANPEWAEVLGIRRAAPDDPSAQESGPRWHYEEGRIHEVRGVRFACMHHSYGKAEFDQLFDAFLKTKPKFDVLVMHQYLKQVLGVNGVWEADSEDMAKKLQGTGCRLVICGHTHTPRHWLEGDILFVSPGGTCPLSTRAALESFTDDHRFPVIDIQPEGVPSVEWRNITRLRRAERGDARPDAGQDNILKRVDDLVAWRARCGMPADLSVPYLEVCCEPSREFTDRMRERAGTDVHVQFVWAADVKKEEESFTEEGDGETLAERIVRGKYPEGDLRDTLLEVLAGGDVDAAVEKRIERLAAVPPVQRAVPA